MRWGAGDSDLSVEVDANYRNRKPTVCVPSALFVQSKDAEPNHRREPAVGSQQLFLTPDDVAAESLLCHRVNYKQALRGIPSRQ